MRIAKKILLIALFLAPFILGTVGYVLMDKRVIDAMYHAVEMYILNAGTENNNILTEIARWTAPVMTVSGIVVILREMFESVQNFFVGFSPDAVAVYGDAELCGIVKKSLRHVIISKNNVLKEAKSHIILFDSDEEGLKFYEKNKEKLRKRDVYIKLESSDCFNISLDEVKFFNPSEITARKYWQENHLLEVCDKAEVKIAIIGSGDVAGKLLSYGLLNNIYTLSQKIEYHVWGENSFFEKLHSDFCFMNSDRLIFEKEKAEESIFEIASCDRIIITEQQNLRLLAALSNVTMARIDCYDPFSGLVNIFGCDRIFTFGKYEDVLTVENIKTENLYRFAKELNYAYAQRYDDEVKEKSHDKEKLMEKKWKGLNSFTKGSNVAACDYHMIRLLIMDKLNKTECDRELAELEHIRWCRYHFLNHWKYGQTADGKKDSERKIHPCLKPFGEISQQEQDKDAESINVLLSLKNTKA